MSGMAKQENFLVDGKTFQLTSWGTRKQIQRIPSIGNMIGVPLAMIASSYSINPSEVEEDSIGQSMKLPLTIQEALKNMFFSMSEGQLEILVDTLLEGVVYNKETVNLDSAVLEDNIGTVITLCAKNLMFQYSGLFEGKGLSDLLKQMGNLAQV